MPTEPIVTRVAAILNRLPEVAPEQQRRLLDENAGLLLGEEADGALAVLTRYVAREPEARTMCEAIRTGLEDARVAGLSPGRTVADFLGGFDNDAYAPLRAMPTVRADDDRAVACRIVAFLEAVSWRTRARIVRAFPDWFAGPDPAAMLRGFAADATGRDGDVMRRLADVCDRVRSAGPRFFDDADLPYLVLRPGICDGPPAVMTESEMYQFMILSYIEAPSWGRRRDLVDRHHELLDDAALMELDHHLEAHPEDRRATTARTALTAARRDGAHVHRRFAADPRMAFVPTFRPTLMDWANAAAASGDRFRMAATFRAVMHSYDPAVAPITWGQANLALAMVLGNVPNQARYDGIAAVSAEEAIIRCYDALAVLVPIGAEDAERAAVALADTLAGRHRGDRAASLGAARDLYSAMYEQHRAANRPAEAAEMAVSAARAMVNMPSSDPISRLAEVLRLSEEAAALHREAGTGVPHQLVLTYAAALIGLAERWVDPAQYTAVAIANLRTVLDGSGDDPVAYASAACQLATAWFYRFAVAPEERADGLAEASSVLERALTRIGGDGHARNRGLLYEHLAKISFGYDRDDPGMQQKSLDHRRKALAVFTPEAYPADRRRALINLGLTYFRARDWTRCAEAFDEASRLGLEMEQLAVSAFGRYGEIIQQGESHQLHAFALLRLGRPGDALRRLDLGKARTFREFQGDVGVATLEQVEPRDLVPRDGALVVPLITRRGGVLWILTDRPDEPADGVVLALPDDVEAGLREILDGAGGWFSAYGQFLAAAQGGDAERWNVASQQWAEVIDRTCGQLWDPVVAPVVAHLRRAQVRRHADVVFVLAPQLAPLPLHAAWQQRADGVRTYLCDEYTVSYTPSLHLLNRTRQRWDRPASPDRLLAVADPGLPHAKPEVQTIRATFPAGTEVLVLAEPDTGPGDVLPPLTACTYAHFACHAAFDQADPWRSAVQMPDGQPLSRGDLTGPEPAVAAKLVTLASCESGITDSRQTPDEYVGLAGAFLHAGAACTVSSLWTASDGATRELMTSFYGHHVAGRRPVAEALRLAQRDVRALPRYRHPYFWAGFLATGSATTARPRPVSAIPDRAGNGGSA